MLAIVATGVIAAAQSKGWQARPETVAQAGKQQPGVNYDESRVAPYTLPDPLAYKGKKITSALTWPPRRAEILDLFRTNVYGRSPGKSEHIAFSVIEENPKAMDGAATLRRIAISSRQGARSHRFELTLFLPNKRPGAAPVFLLINNRPPSNTDPTRREKSGFWPAEQIIARGYGIAAFHYAELAPDDEKTFRDGVIKFFDDGSTAYTWGALAAWGWGASRAMDYFETDPRVDKSHVAVVGHSRGGKAALWAGAEDERFAMVISNDSGEGGAALSRRNFGETLQRITTSFPHWFTAAYNQRASVRERASPSERGDGVPASAASKGVRGTKSPDDGSPAELPVDQHMLLSLIAPRALYVASADEDLWADPRGEFLSLAATSPVFALWGDAPIRDADMPAIDTPLVVGRRGYHIRTGGHNLTPYDWDRYADFADRVWKR
jgi:(4-O-methyl)-D-glucuronate---lignin esterase